VHGTSALAIEGSEDLGGDICPLATVRQKYALTFGPGHAEFEAFQRYVTSLLATDSILATDSYSARTDGSADVNSHSNLHSSAQSPSS
jgi:hypothetical protein